MIHVKRKREPQYTAVLLPELTEPYPRVPSGARIRKLGGGWSVGTPFLRDPGEVVIFRNDKFECMTSPDALLRDWDVVAPPEDEYDALVDNIDEMLEND